jgi:hypothetical protein
MGFDTSHISTSSLQYSTGLAVRTTLTSRGIRQTVCIPITKEFSKDYVGVGGGFDDYYYYH